MNEDYIQNLLSNWEETYKQGQLSFWILISLKIEPKSMSEIKNSIEILTDKHVSCEDQSLYRSLRKFYDLGIIDFKTEQGFKGPDKKNYFLTKDGKVLLQKFIERNINIFLKKDIQKLINK